MTHPREDLQRVVAGEVSAQGASGIRQHLPGCESCQSELARLLDLEFRALSVDERQKLPALVVHPPRGPGRRWRPGLRAGVLLALPLLALGVVGLGPSVGIPRPSWRSTVLAFVAPDATSDVWLTGPAERLLEARLEHPGAEVHRPLVTGVARDRGLPEDVSPEVREQLEREDPLGLAEAFLARVEERWVRRALHLLEQQPRSARRDTDLAVAHWLGGQPLAALRLLETVLREQPGHAPARWNRALVLRELGLPLVAALDFDAVAARQEPGWAREATARAEHLRQETFSRRDRWKARHTLAKAGPRGATAEVSEATEDIQERRVRARERAEEALATGDRRKAVKLLREAFSTCHPHEAELPCISLDEALSRLHVLDHRAASAREHAERGRANARARDEWRLESDLLWTLAQAQRRLGDASLARLYLEEYRERAPDAPEDQRRVHEDLASLAFLEARMEDARAELDAALATGLPLSLQGAHLLADLSRVKRSPLDLEHLEAALRSASFPDDTSQKATSSHLLGRFFLEEDAMKGRELLRRALVESRPLGTGQDGLVARRAREGSYALLIQEAGARGAFEEALGLFEQEHPASLPRQCLLAATAEVGQVLLLARGSRGELLGSVEKSWRQPLAPRLDGLVPETMLTALWDCPRVQVVARQALRGKAGLLPPEMAWSHLVGRGAPASRRTGTDSSFTLTWLKGVTLPAHARSNIWRSRGSRSPHPRLFSQEDKLQEHFFDAVGDATEIDLAAHGVIESASGDAFQLLAQGTEGMTLGLSRLRATPLRGAPLVVLRASAMLKDSDDLYVFDAANTLPAAFIEAGARGVLAATTAIPTVDAGLFFAAVRARIRTGSPPAVALRDERLRWQRDSASKPWLDGVLLYE